MSTDIMTAERWHRVAARHMRLKAAMTAKAVALQADLQKAAATHDLKGLASVVARCNHNVRRLHQMDRVMARHARRYRVNVKIQNQH
jgi:CTP synthase (UTP-ammonia lyase)